MYEGIGVHIGGDFRRLLAIFLVSIFVSTLAHSGQIGGVVTSIETSDPIADGFVYVYDSSGSYVGLDSLDSSGKYTYSGLDSGTYYVRTSSTGYFDELWDDISCPQDQCSSTSGTPIEVTAGLTSTADFQLETGGAILGMVTSSVTSDPISDGFVYVYDSSGSFVGLDSLDNSGQYAYSGLDSGTYYIHTSSTGYFDELWDGIPCPQDQCNPASGTAIEVTAGLNSNANFQLAPGGAIVGTVTSAETSDPIPDGFVYVYDSTGSFLGLDSLDSSGQYRYSGLDSGTYFVHTSSTGFFDELWDDIPCPDDQCNPAAGTPIAVTIGVDSIADFQLSTGGAIAGTVTSVATSDPIPDGFVYVYDSSGSYVGLDSLDSSGQYTYSGLDSGTYYVHTSATGYFDELWDNIPCPQDDCNPATGTAIDVTSGVMEAANFQLDSGASITGTVVSADTGDPISDGYIHVYDSNGEFLGLDSLDSSGQFTYSGLDSGTYYIRTSSTGYLDELWDNLPCAQDECNPASGTPIQISIGQTFTADFKLGLEISDVERIFMDSFEQ